MKRLFFTFIVLGCSLLLTAQYHLPNLPFKYNALEPFIDSATMNIHLNQHHAAYVANLNKALEKYPSLRKKSLIELLAHLNKLPNDIQLSVRNNGGGHFNHSLFWNLLSPAGKAPMSEFLQKKIEENFGTVELFKDEFEKAALNQSGSGWVWLIPNERGKLKIVTTPNQDNTLMSAVEIRGTPVLALDVWEHAYYLKYQSRRANYVKAFWNIVNWTEVERLINVAEKLNQ